MNTVVALKQPEPATPKLYLKECVVTHAGGMFRLSKRQAALLAFFIKRKNRLMTVEELITFVDPMIKSTDGGALYRTTLSYLKDRLAAHGIALRIETRRSLGRVYYGDVELAPPGEEFVFEETRHP